MPSQNPELTIQRMPNPSHQGMPVSAPRISPVPIGPHHTVPNRPGRSGTRTSPVNTGSHSQISPVPAGPNHAVPNRMTHPASNPQSRVSPVNIGPHSRISPGPNTPHSRISPGPTGPHHAVPNRMAHPASNPQSRVSPVNIGPHSRISPGPTGPNNAVTNRMGHPGPNQQSRVSLVNTGPHSRISPGPARPNHQISPDPTGPHHAVTNRIGHPGATNVTNQQTRISPVNTGPHRRISPGPNGQHSRISPVNAGPHSRVSPVNIGSHSRISPGPSPPQNAMPLRMAHPGLIHRGVAPPRAMQAVQGPVNYPPNMAVTTTTWYPPHEPRHYNVTQSVPRPNVPISVQNQFHTQMMNMQQSATSQVQQRHQGPTSPLQVHIVPQIPGQGARLPVNQHQGQQVHHGQGHQVHSGQQVHPGQAHQHRHQQVPIPAQSGQIQNTMAYAHVQGAPSFPPSSQASMVPWPNPQASHVSGSQNQSHQNMPAPVQIHQHVGVNHALPTSNPNGPSPNNNSVQPSVNPTSRITQPNQPQTGHDGQTQNGIQTNEAFSWYNMKHQTPSNINQGDIKLSPSAKLEKSRIKGKVDPSTIHIDPDNPTPHLELPTNSNVDIEVPPNAIVIQPEDDLDYPGTPPPCMSPIRDDLEDSPLGKLKILVILD